MPQRAKSADVGHVGQIYPEIISISYEPRRSVGPDTPAEAMDWSDESRMDIVPRRACTLKGDWRLANSFSITPRSGSRKFSDVFAMDCQGKIALQASSPTHPVRACAFIILPRIRGLRYNFPRHCREILQPSPSLNEYSV
jgi:hypothetical protein